MNAQIAQLNVPAFNALEAQPADALLGIIAQFRADSRPDKLDLGIGVYRDDTGACPILGAVKEAERRLVAEQTSKGYLGAEGDIGFVEHIARLALGPDAALGGRQIGLQTPGGGGALRLAAELYRRARPQGWAWIGMPTWPNHAPIFTAAGVPIATHPFYDVATGTVQFDLMMEALSHAAPGDAVLLHGCCHNPTGAQLTPDQWQALIAWIARRGLLPIMDLAYHGLGDGLDADAAAARALFAAVPEAMLAYSCDKNFGLYRDRVGALMVQGATAEQAAVARGNLLAIARSAWSMPPDHGAAVVRIILDDSDLAARWEAELALMRGRLNGIRGALAAAHPRLAAIGAQRGLFALLPLSPADVAAARAQAGIYMAGDGRINIAGLRHDRIDAFAAAIAPALERGRAFDLVHG